jgi:putative membrane protein
MTTEEIGGVLAFVNACLNGTCAVLLWIGRRAILSGPRSHPASGGPRSHPASGGGPTRDVATPVITRAEYVRTHRRRMIAAVAVSAAFLTSYLTRVALTGTHADPHTGVRHAAYLAILGSHMILAILVVPMVLAALWLAHKTRFTVHRRLARVTFPIWLYVSVTGVVVYLMLYVIP